MPKKKVADEHIYEAGVEAGIVVAEAIVENRTEKERLLEVYTFMKDHGINSISDIENRIARAE